MTQALVLLSGAGINQQSNDVRELYEWESGPAALDAVGIQTREWMRVRRGGQDVYCEPRACRPAMTVAAWVHHGRLQELQFCTVRWVQAPPLSQSLLRLADRSVRAILGGEVSEVSVGARIVVSDPGPSHQCIAS